MSTPTKRRPRKCRCLILTADKKKIDIRCHRKTPNADGICDDCRKHRIEDRRPGAPYRDRLSLRKR